MSAAWAGVVVTAVGSLIALGLLIFEVRTAHSERRRREDAEAKAKRDMALERARRVVAWIEPIRWQINREGMVVVRSGGWKLVVSNDTDDTISNWHALVVRPSLHDRDEVLLEAAVVEHGVIPPRSRFEADISEGTNGEEVPPTYQDLEAIAVLSWVDRDAEVWHSRGAAGPFRIPREDGRWSVSHVDVAARLGGRYEIHRQSYVVIRLN